MYAGRNDEMSGPWWRARLPRLLTFLAVLAIGLASLPRGPAAAAESGCVHEFEVCLHLEVVQEHALSFETDPPSRLEVRDRVLEALRVRIDRALDLCPGHEEASMLRQWYEEMRARIDAALSKEISWLRPIPSPRIAQSVRSALPFGLPDVHTKDGRVQAQVSRALKHMKHVEGLLGRDAREPTNEPEAKRKLLAALAHYEKSQRIYPTAVVAAHKGVVLQLLGRCDEAMLAADQALVTVDGSLVHFVATRFDRCGATEPKVAAPESMSRRSLNPQPSATSERAGR